MSKITISEKDLTISNEVDVASNVVFVPGITSSIAEDKPTLFTSVSQFTQKYGTTPYKFASDQVVDGKTVVSANEYEKSYIYAIELLNVGIPVLFQNVVNVKDECSFNLATIDSSTYVKSYYYTLSSVESTTASTEYAPYKYLILDTDKYVYASDDEYDEDTTYFETTLATGDFDNTATYYEYIDSNILSQYYTKLSTSPTCYSNVLDKWTYNIKFISTGGYPTLLDSTQVDLLQTLAMASAVRGDSVSLVDSPINESVYTTFTNINTKIQADLEDATKKQNYFIKGGDANKCNLVFKLNANRLEESTLKYATIIGPQGTYNIANEILKLNEIETIVLPGSFGYLLSLANSVETLNNPDYFAIAGVTRGKVPQLAQLTVETTGAEADAVQVRPAKVGSEGVGTISVNPIVKVQNYDYCIWGNRTLFPNPIKDLAASSFLNIRVLSADVKKQIYASCQKLTFETNNLELWLKLKSEIEPLLEKMVADGALEDYELTRLVSTEKATLTVYVKLVAEYAVEDFNVTIGLTDSTVEIAE